MFSNAISHNNSHEFKKSTKKIVLRVWFERELDILCDWQNLKMVFLKLWTSWFMLRERVFDYICVGVNGIKMSKMDPNDLSQDQSLWFHSNERMIWIENIKFRYCTLDSSKRNIWFESHN